MGFAQLFWVKSHRRLGKRRVGIPPAIPLAAIADAITCRLILQQTRVIKFSLHKAYRLTSIGALTTRARKIMCGSTKRNISSSVFSYIFEPKQCLQVYRYKLFNLSFSFYYIITYVRYTERERERESGVCAKGATTIMRHNDDDDDDDELHSRGSSVEPRRLPQSSLFSPYLFFCPRVYCTLYLCFLRALTTCRGYYKGVAFKSTKVVSV